jgi:hypothetical protein
VTTYFVFVIIGAQAGVPSSSRPSSTTPLFVLAVESFRRRSRHRCAPWSPPGSSSRASLLILLA